MVCCRSMTIRAASSRSVTGGSHVDNCWRLLTVVLATANGKGRWVDNVFLERLWRSLKYEEVYLKAYKTLLQARAGISW